MVASDQMNTNAFWACGGTTNWAERSVRFCLWPRKRPQVSNHIPEAGVPGAAPQGVTGSMHPPCVLEDEGFSI